MDDSSMRWPLAVAPSGALSSASPVPSSLPGPPRTVPASGSSVPATVASNSASLPAPPQLIRSESTSSGIPVVQAAVQAPSESAPAKLEVQSPPNRAASLSRTASASGGRARTPPVGEPHHDSPHGSPSEPSHHGSARTRSLSPVRSERWNRSRRSIRSTRSPSHSSHMSTEDLPLASRFRGPLYQRYEVIRDGGSARSESDPRSSTDNHGTGGLSELRNRWGGSLVNRLGNRQTPVCHDCNGPHYRGSLICPNRRLNSNQQNRALSQQGQRPGAWYGLSLRSRAEDQSHDGGQRKRRRLK